MVKALVQGPFASNAYNPEADDNYQDTVVETLKNLSIQGILSSIITLVFNYNDNWITLGRIHS